MDEEKDVEEGEGRRLRFFFWAVHAALGTHVPRTRNWLTHSTATTEAALPYWPSHNVVVFCTFRAARDELRMRNAAMQGAGMWGGDRLRRAGEEWNNDMATIFYARATSSRCAASVSPSPALLFFMSNYNCFG